MATVELKGLDPIFVSFPFTANARSGLPTNLANETEVGKEAGGGVGGGGMGEGVWGEDAGGEERTPPPPHFFLSFFGGGGVGEKTPAEMWKNKQKGSDERLFILTRTHSMYLFYIYIFLWTRVM